jgi:hypothetical protein
MKNRFKPSGITVLHYGVDRQPLSGSSGGPCLKSALQLGIRGPVLKPCGFQTTRIGGPAFPFTLTICIEDIAVAPALQVTMP